MPTRAAVTVLAAVLALPLLALPAHAAPIAHACDAISGDEMVRLFSKTFEPARRLEPAKGATRCEWVVASGGTGAFALDLVTVDAKARYDALKTESGAEVITRLPGEPVWIGARNAYTFLAGDVLATIHFPDVYLPKGLGEQFLKLVRPRLLASR